MNTAQINEIQTMLKDKSINAKTKDSLRIELQELQEAHKLNAAKNAAERTALHVQAISLSVINMTESGKATAQAWQTMLSRYPSGVCSDTSKAIRDAIKAAFKAKGIDVVTAKTLVEREEQAKDNPNLKAPSASDWQAANAYDTACKYVGTLRKVFDAHMNIEPSTPYAIVAKSLLKPAGTPELSDVLKAATRIGKLMFDVDATLFNAKDNAKNIEQQVVAAFWAGFNAVEIERAEALENAKAALVKAQAKLDALNGL
jgi:hypothetical protein